MKIIALDIGDRWVGVAISDALGITCRPLETVSLEKLDAFLVMLLSTEPIGTVIVGYPLTLKGTQSAQTKKIITLKNQLEKKHEIIEGRTISWILWDERLSSKRAQEIIGSGPPSKEAKRKEHALAASFILQSYLDHQALAPRTS